jgi:hypothetical protein
MHGSANVCERRVTSARCVRLKYLSEDPDRHGNVRCYVRMPGKRKVRIRALPGTPEFMEEYQAAIAQAKADVYPRSR